MKQSPRHLVPPLFVILVIASLFPVYDLSAAEDTAAMKDRIEALEKELAEVKELLKQQVRQSATKEEVQAVKKDVEEEVNL